MTFDCRSAGDALLALGRDGDRIDLADGDFEVPRGVRGVVVTGGGDVCCRPLDAATDISMVNVPTGYMLPWACSHIRKKGTSATLATVQSLVGETVRAS